MPATQANVEYWFRLLYECFHGTCYPPADWSSLLAFLSHLWIYVVYIGYLLSIIALLVIIYATVQLFELREREHEFYTTLITPPETEGGPNPRWAHIESLVNGTTPSEWKEAIIEADIMLDDVLKKEGFVGENLGERLKGADKEEFGTLNDAWEAHKVRNEIAHKGSKFALTEQLARRTIAHYETVFREFNAL